MTGMNSTISIAIIKEWLTQSVAVGVGGAGAGAAAGGGLVLSLINIPAGQYGTSVSFLLFNISRMLVSSSGSSPSSSSSSS